MGRDWLFHQGQSLQLLWLGTCQYIFLQSSKTSYVYDYNYPWEWGIAQLSAHCRVGSQRITLWSWLSPSAFSWVLVIEVQSPGLPRKNAFTRWIISPALSPLLFFLNRRKLKQKHVTTDCTSFVNAVEFFFPPPIDRSYWSDHMLTYTFVPNQWVSWDF